MNKLPFIQSGELVCVICEGPEEYDYLNRIKELGVWDKGYRVDLVNAHGNGSLPARYQDKFQNGSYDIVLVFCDTDRKPFEQYRDIKRKHRGYDRYIWESMYNASDHPALGRGYSSIVI